MRATSRAAIRAGLAAGLAVAVARGAPWQEQVPARPIEPPKAAPVEPTPPLPLLSQLSNEVSALRRMATSRVRVDRGPGKEPLFGAYLGEGIVVTPYVEGEPAGSIATLGWQTECYRLVLLERTRLPWVSFWKLRDWPVDPQPALPKLLAEEVLDSGELVLVVGVQQARLSIVDRWGWDDVMYRRRGGERGQESNQRPDRGRFFGIYSLADTDSTPGSVVLTTEGDLLGLLVRASLPARPETPREPRVTEPKPGGDRAASGRSPETRAEPKSGEASPPPAPRVPRETTLVLSTHRLIEEGRLALAKPLLASVAPQLGITLWRSLGPDGGQRVTRVAVGCPAGRAGVAVNDVWLKLNDQPLRRHEQVRELLKASQAGDLMRVVYRRGTEERELTFRL